MIKTLFHTLRQRWMRHQSLGLLLARHDSHLLDDIGLSRHDVARILQAPAQFDPVKTDLRCEGFQAV